MVCGAVRVLEPQETTLDFPALCAEALTAQQAIDYAVMRKETKSSSTEMVAMHQTGLCHTLQNINFDQLYIQGVAEK
jgi:hypothetical protein